MDNYFKPQHLADFAQVSDASPALGRKFFDYYGAVFADGALSAREKSLIALAVAHAVQCPYCIDAYTQDCQQKGADREQMTEALHVAVAIRGGASLVHGMQMREQAKKMGM
ncbi:MAG: arsenosugar biosynthesis-associated peroxidase-like protein [Betaproteobacteria bacterium]|nr:arsenosugar biosynthesis-associated peroxidase-like protein [Betaproteobacteria bacterium]MDH4322899.1 arsenosugar biosynthesis-associated peroxidase-like protein [Betaproteobacteria bacterium]MDH5211185.1 arsenosugar biosynthesis-associated peroxidase-like protein [Betaproteobacteria bacterium]MDH5579123.1 arsenosugar biosynthesis-associated peroxidase-like protein [Betaproteobacteria bacterium]